MQDGMREKKKQDDMKRHKELQSEVSVHSNTPYVKIDLSWGFDEEDGDDALSA